MLHGHGSKERQQRGPPTATGEPTVVTLMVRCYHCQGCRAVIRSAPRTVCYRRLYSAPAIALALALWGVARLTVAEVRGRISPWKVIGNSAPKRWPTLRKWATAVKARAMLVCVRQCPDHFTLRQVAERAATTLAGLCPSDLSGLGLSAQTFIGAAHAN